MLQLVEKNINAFIGFNVSSGPTRTEQIDFSIKKHSSLLERYPSLFKDQVERELRNRVYNIIFSKLNSLEEKPINCVKNIKQIICPTHFDLEKLDKSIQKYPVKLFNGIKSLIGLSHIFVRLEINKANSYIINDREGAVAYISGILYYRIEGNILGKRVTRVRKEKTIAPIQPAVQEKRKRGRPRKETSNTSRRQESAKEASTSVQPIITEKRKRGRPRKT